MMFCKYKAQLMGESVGDIPTAWTLELGEVKPSTITLQLADRSLTYPRWIVDNVLMNVEKFNFSADFMILDMEEDQYALLIFGRPFLAIDRALIDVHKGELTWRVGGGPMMFYIYKAIKEPRGKIACGRSFGEMSD
ncbi:uncharacterized protein LOC142519763 [Primulina tabacum]|uniref:uncharacterized protein LOC142519763 n=1 Tax=Primulina tabacum TaxID=48773 RepID=UPI003F5A56D6